ncbi:MAG: phage holin family protein [Sporomusaceae bacterium]|nr:phage holin family protein [Sporomusaceae bacterium]
MCGFLIRALLNAIILFLLITNLPDVSVATLGGTLLVVCAFGFANASIRPALAVMALRPSFFLVSAFTLLVNIVILSLLIKILPGVKTPAWGDCVSWAMLLFLALLSFILTKLIKDR